MDNIEGEQKDRKIDENWKESIEREKAEAPKKENEHFRDEHIADFNLFISSLAMQAFVYLGLMPDPVTQKTQTDLTHARYIIDTIQMLKDKTKNNLTVEENANIDETLYTLRMKFFEHSES